MRNTVLMNLDFLNRIKEEFDNEGKIAKVIVSSYNYDLPNGDTLHMVIKFHDDQATINIPLDVAFDCLNMRSGKRDRRLTVSALCHHIDKNLCGYLRSMQCDVVFDAKDDCMITLEITDKTKVQQTLKYINFLIFNICEYIKSPYANFWQYCLDIEDLIKKYVKKSNEHFANLGEEYRYTVDYVNPFERKFFVYVDNEGVFEVYINRFKYTLCIRNHLMLDMLRYRFIPRIEANVFAFAVKNIARLQEHLINDLQGTEVGYLSYDDEGEPVENYHVIHCTTCSMNELKSNIRKCFKYSLDANHFANILQQKY